MPPVVNGQKRLDRKSENQVEQDERQNPPAKSPTPVRRYLVSMEEAGHKHGARNPENRPRGARRDTLRQRHRKQDAAHAADNVNQSEPPVAVHPLENPAEDVERIAINKEVEHADVQKHRHDQTEIFAAADVRSIRGAELNEQFRVRRDSCERAQKKILERRVRQKVRQRHDQKN